MWPNGEVHPDPGNQNDSKTHLALGMMWLLDTWTILAAKRDGVVLGNVFLRVWCKQQKHNP